MRNWQLKKGNRKFDRMDFLDSLQVWYGLVWFSLVWYGFIRVRAALRKIKSKLISCFLPFS